MRTALLLLCGSPLIWAATLPPATAAAFDRYVKLTEEEQAKRSKPGNFLWLDSHPERRTLVWMNQPLIAPIKTLDGGNEIEVPDGSLQDWLGAIYLDGATLERVRDMVLNYADYKYFFKQQVIESRLVKREGDRFDSFLRVHKRQIRAVVLNINASAQYTSLDPTHAYIVCHSTHIGEVNSPNEKKQEDQERDPQDEYGYLWRLNVYWRFAQVDNGVYAEVELISLSRAAGSLSAGRFLNGFVQNFPREFTEGMIEGLRVAFPRPRN